VGKRLGLIIGVNNYHDTTFRSLQFAETDARALAQWLVHVRGGQWNPEDVQLVLGSEVTRELVESLVSRLCLNTATADDMVLIYFAGYAFVDQVSGDGCLACTNTRYQQSSSGLHVPSLVSQVLARSSAAQILCILDCFQIGSVWNMRRSSPFDYKPLIGPILQSDLQQMQGRLLYCTCRGTERTPEVSEKNLGSFMYRLVMGAGIAASDSHKGQVTLQSLHDFLSEKLDEQHRPQVFGQESRPLVLVGEMPVLRTGTLGGRRTGSLVSPNGLLANQASTAVAVSELAQLSPTGSNMSGPPPLFDMPAPQPLSLGMGQATLATVEHNRLQQCQQMLGKAKQLVLAQNLQQAYQLTETILQMHPTFLEALILKGQILGGIGRYDEALKSVKQVVQIDPENPLGWSMAAALLANTGQYPEAMSAVDRSLSLDPTNTETISIKEMIREKLAEVQVDSGKRSRLVAPKKKPRDSVKAFMLGMGLQFFGLLLGIAGAFLLLIKPNLPILIGFLLDSVGLALLCVNAWRGSYLYGWKRFLLTLFFSLITVGLTGALYVVKPAYNFIVVNHVENSFGLIIPLVFLVLWLVAAAVLPLLLSLIAWIAGAIVHARHKDK
jgi:hypothetical protein